jgi:hypothetical protein
VSAPGTSLNFYLTYLHETDAKAGSFGYDISPRVVLYDSRVRPHHLENRANQSPERRHDGIQGENHHRKSGWHHYQDREKDYGEALKVG